MRKIFQILSIVLILAGCQSNQHPTKVSTSTMTVLVTPTSAISVSPTSGSMLGVKSVSEYLGVRPTPGAVYSVAGYERLAPSLEWGANAPGICVGVSPLGFLEPGDFPTTEEWLSRIHLVVDSKYIAEYHSILMTDSRGKEVADAETGKILYKAPDGSPYRICYAVPLDVGRHSIAFVVQNSSGEETSYTWGFTIVE